MAATKQTEANKALVRRVYDEILNEKDYDRYEELYAEDFVSHRPPPGADEGYSDLDSTKTYHRRLHEGFPDLTETIEEIIAEDDMCAVRLTITGTHEGEFMGVPATGKEVSFEAMVFSRIEDGKLAEAWGLADSLDLMGQLGITEVPGA